MTNFEFIAKDESTLANWLCDRMDCHMCPVETECSKDCGPIYDRCYRLILEWLERDEEAEERSTCQDSRQVGLEGLHPDDVKAVKEILERARNNPPKARRDEPKIDAETVIKFITQHFGCLCEWDFDDEDCGDYMDENHPEICEVCRMQNEDICKCWEIYIREKSQEEGKNNAV